MKSLFLSLLLALPAFVFGQLDQPSSGRYAIELSMGYQQNGPFFNQLESSSLQSLTTLGVQRHWLQTETHRWYQSLELGMLTDFSSVTGFQATTMMGYQWTFLGSFFIAGELGGGAMRVGEPSEILREDQEISTEEGWLAMTNGSLKLGFQPSNFGIYAIYRLNGQWVGAEELSLFPAQYAALGLRYQW